MNEFTKKEFLSKVRVKKIVFDKLIEELFIE